MSSEYSENEERFLDDPDTLQELMDDEDATQCVESENIINAKDSTSNSSPPSEEDHPFGSNTLDDFIPDILEITNDDLLSNVSQISDQCEPVCKRKGITSYKYGTSCPLSCSEYEPSKVNENETDRDKRRDRNQRKKLKIADMQNKVTNIKKEINDNNKKI